MKKMNLKWMTVPVMVLLASVVCAAEPVVLKTEQDKINYALGVSMVNSVKQQGGEVNLDLLIKGMKDGLTGEHLLMTEGELRGILAARQSAIDEEQKRAASRSDTTLPASADAGQNNEPAVPKNQDHPEQRDDQVPSNVTFAKKEGQAQKPASGRVNGHIQPMQAPLSVAERGMDRNTNKLRALEMRKRSIEQGL